VSCKFGYRPGSFPLELWSHVLQENESSFLLGSVRFTNTCFAIWPKN